MSRIPRGFTIFIWCTRIVGLAFLAFSFSKYTIVQQDLLNISFLLMALLLIFARLGGLFKLFDLKVSIGWANSIEFCAAFILPFPYFCLVMVVSFATIVVKRLVQKHSEPFLGPDLNATSVIIGAYISMSIYNYLDSITPNLFIFSTVSLILAAIVFGSIQVVMITTVISLHEKKSWFKVGTLSADSLISEVVVVMTGALIGKIYSIDPSSLLLIVLPLLFMHNLLKKINENKLIYVDEKTGLYNYKYFDEHLSKMYDHAKKHNQQLSVIFGDMDFLRDINNTHGHMAGDVAIAFIGKVLKENIAPDMIASRFGGEEFVVLAPNSTKEESYLLAEHIRKKIATETIEHNGVSFNVTMSFGVATYPEDAFTMDDLVQKADETLYESKRTGRNKVMAFGLTDKSEYPSLDHVGGDR